MKRQYFLFFLHLLCIFWTNAEPLVELSQGLLNGTIEESRNGRKYAAFLGIPYAKPPIGNLRFRNPEPAGKWNGILQANSFGSACPQLVNDKIIGSEDCLFLNVYTPRLFNSSLANKEVKKTLFPVMVFIHGGGFIRGTSDCCRANYLLDKDIVLVVMNYRVGIFGFLSLGNSAAPGNFGLKDQVLSLKWIQENIEAFGGDPKKITLFGQSAGGMSTGLHALSKASEGLFHQYMIHSGSPLDDWTYKKRSYFIEHAKKLALLVSCPSNTSESFIACLRTKSVDTLLNSKSIFGEFADYTNIYWTPTDEPEADGSFLTDSPSNLMEQNQMKDLPFLTGCVTDEGLANTARLSNDASRYSFTLSKLDQLIPFIAGRALVDSKNEKEFTRAAKQFYFDDDFSDKDKFIENFTNYVGDAQFIYPEVKMLEKAGPKMKSPIYWYSFGYRGSFGHRKREIEKKQKQSVGHAADFAFIFPVASKLNFTDTDRSISNLMVDLLTSFASNGKPRSEQFKSDDFWVPYNPIKAFHLQIGSESNNEDPAVTISSTYFTKRMEFWRKYANT